MKRLLPAMLVAAIALGLSPSASADPPRPPRAARTTRAPRARRPPPTPALTLAVEWEGLRDYHVRVRLDAARDLAEAVADLRWLTFDVAAPGRRRPLTCAYPSAPTRNDASKVVSSVTGGSALLDAVIDLRMYCVGAAYEAVRAGATLTPRYGVRSANATRFVASELVGRRTTRTARVEGATFQRPAPFVAAEPVDEAALAISVPTMDVSRAASLVARPTVEARREARIYLRPDLWSFEVRSPDGRVRRCEPERRPVVPIVDFFTRLSAGRRASATLDLGHLCPDLVGGPGIYDVVPVLELVYDGGNVGLTALTGTFRGRASFIRVRAPADVDPSELVRPLPTGPNAL